ncbi:MAG TPA: hypothetical protein VII51_12495 [Gaiellaceae bacterium]
MNPTGFPPHRGGGFGPSTLTFHQAHPGALAWATFALVLLLVLTVFALLVARLARRSHRRGWGHGSPGRRHFMVAGPGPEPGPGMDDPLGTLRWRYARGEIGRDEFLLATSDLTTHGEPAPPPPS